MSTEETKIEATVVQENKGLTKKQAAKLAKRTLRAKINATLLKFKLKRNGMWHDHTEACDAKKENGSSKECTCPKPTDPNAGHYIFEHGKSEVKYYVNPLRHTNG